MRCAMPSAPSRSCKPPANWPAPAASWRRRWPHIRTKRACERERKYDRALAKWEDLRRIDCDYPDLDRSVEHVRAQQEQILREAREKWAADIHNALERAELERAASLAQQARREFPQDREFAAQEEEIRATIERRAKAEKQIAS